MDQIQGEDYDPIVDDVTTTAAPSNDTAAPAPAAAPADTGDALAGANDDMLPLFLAEQITTTTTTTTNLFSKRTGKMRLRLSWSKPPG